MGAGNIETDVDLFSFLLQCVRMAKYVGSQDTWKSSLPHYGREKKKLTPESGRTFSADVSTLLIELYLELVGLALMCWDVKTWRWRT